MKKRLIPILLWVSLLPLALAELELNFVSSDEVSFNGYLLNLKFGDAVYKELMDDSLVNVPTTAVGKFTATLDFLDTPAIDYFGTTIIDKEKTDFWVYPTGYLKGKVLDANGNLVPYAELTFDCYSTTIFDRPNKADNIGFFSVKNMPVGSCSVVASKKGVVGSVEVEVGRGEVVSVEVVLGESLVKQDNSVWWLFLGLLLFLVVLLGIWFGFKKKNKKEKHKKGQIKERETELTGVGREEKISKQTLALMKTLSGKEKKVADFLLEHDNKSSQAKIRHSTGIPRTSLTRVLQSLEDKKIAKIEKMGKMVSVKLTWFFLGKE